MYTTQCDIPRPQDNLLGTTFFELLAELSKARLSVAENGVPLINKTALFYSTDEYSFAARQYFVGQKDARYRKHYNIKPPVKSVGDLWENYSQSFRRNVRRSLRSGFRPVWSSGQSVVEATRETLYGIHVEATSRIGTFSLPRPFFMRLFDIEGCVVSVVVVENRAGDPVAFQLLLGNLAYVSGTRVAALRSRVGNYLVHHIFERYCGEPLFLGTGLIGTGIDRFKRDSGAVQLPCHVIPEPASLPLIHWLSKNTRISKSSCVVSLMNTVCNSRPGMLSIMPYA